MTANERLALIHHKFTWGKKRFLELGTEVQAFCSPPLPVTVKAARDPQTRRPVWYLAEVKEAPASIPLIVGDVLQCLRSTLDHLAYQLLMAGNPSAEPHRVRFPVGRHIAAFRSELGVAKKEGMRQGAIAAIEALEPYPGGKGSLLWTLQGLNNVDKHRIDLATFTSYRAFDFSTFANQIFASKGLAGRLPPIFIGEVGPRRACKVNDVLYIGAPDEDMDEPRAFMSDVAFAEPGALEGVPVVPTLRDMARLVGGIATTFHRDGHLS